MKLNTKVTPLGWPCLSKILLIMKLTAIMLLAALVHVSAKSFSQQVTLHVRNNSIEKVLKAIQKQTGYHFVYESKDIPEESKISLSLENASLTDALDQCLKNQPLTYKIFSKTIVLKKKEQELDPPNALQAQPIKGKVTDNKGQPLPGATVSVKGTNRAVVTAADGTFTITADKGEILVVKFIGFETKEVSIGSETNFTIVINESRSVLSDVVVVGYGTQARATVTAAIVRVDGKNIGNQPVGTPGEALAGLAAGVQVQSDQGAKPGVAPTIRVRGVSSLSTSNEPLYVVDGYPLETSSQFTLLNPNDIESIQILKDAASASIYGSRAANGVVLVTTKRGKSGKIVFSVSAYRGIQDVNRRYHVLNRDEYIANAKNIARIRNTAYPAIFDTDPQSLPDIDWQDQIFRTAPVTDFEFNASGGSEKIRFNASAGYFKQQGVLVGTAYSRYTTRVNLDADIVKNVKFSFSISPSYAEQFRQPASGQFSDVAAAADYLPGVPGLVADFRNPGVLNLALVMPPVSPVRMPNGDYAEPYDRSLPFTLSPTAVYFPSNFFNPLNVLEQVVNRSRAFRTLSNTYVEYTPIPGLKLKSYIGATLENEQIHAYMPATTASRLAPTANLSNPVLTGIFASENARTTFDWVWENTATYDKSIGGHHLNLLGLFSAQKLTSTINYTGALPGTYITTAIQNPLASPNRVGTIGYDDNDFVSYAARLTYDFNRKYLLTAAVRRDGSSRFGPNNRYAVFPSFSLGWRLGEEELLKPLLNKLKINEFKLRGGYGKTGNANIGSFSYLNSISLNTNYAYGPNRQYGVQQSGFPNASLTWEKNTQTDFGIDLGLLQNRINFTVDYFNRISDGMLLAKDLPAIVGYATTYQANQGKLRNRGIEFTLGTDFSIGKIHWTINGNLSSYRTKVLSLGGPSSLPSLFTVNAWSNIYQIKVGDPIGLIYGYQVSGVFKNAAELAAFPQTTSGNKVGDWRIQDQNGDGKIDINDLKVLGHGLPDFTYGLTNTFQYENFDLSILLQGVQGVNIVNGNFRQLQNSSGSSNTIKAFANNYFDPAQPDRDVDFPIPGSGSSVNRGNAFTNKSMENGAYLRVRNITLGYRLGETWAKKIAAKTARIYLTAQNPFLFTKYSGYNPESSSYGGDPLRPGVDEGTYPVARTFIIGITFGF
ncbi:TonB-dependent receptor [Mucilaginibacter sp.]|jgi:TonB-linked SusC/RagA family outer membrane protein|uniref:TonB-dependent receptor n=1 Tax=Mucilaginibacter sp. TaxID=1882438 RepID=UPI0035654C48